MTYAAPQPPRTEYREPRVIARLRVAFTSGADANELRAALRAASSEQAQAEMTPYERAMCGELIGEVAKYLLFAGRA